MTAKSLRRILLLILLVLTSAGAFAGLFAHVEWLQRACVILLLIVATWAITDWMRAATS